MHYNLLKEKVYDIENKTRTDQFVDKISKLTNNGKDESTEMKKALKGFDIALETEKYDLPETISEFKQNIMNIVGKISDEEFYEFMKNISSRKKTLALKDILTNGTSKSIDSINPSWIPKKITLPLIKITKDKMGSGEVYFSILTGGDKKKKGDVNVDGTIIEVKYNKGWILEFPNAMRAIDETKVEIFNALTRTDESLLESKTNPRRARLAKRAVGDLKKYVKNKNNLELVASLMGNTIKMKKSEGSYAFESKVKLTRVQERILSLLNEATTVLRWIYKPVKGSTPFYNETSLDIIGYFKELKGYLTGNSPSRTTKTVIGHLDDMLDAVEKSLDEIRKETKEYTKIAETISKTDSKYFLFATTKKSVWNNAYQAYKNKFKDGDEKFKKVFEHFLDRAFTVLPTQELMKGAFDSVSIDTETVLKNIAEHSFTKYSNNDKWTYLLTIAIGGKKYATFSDSNQFRKAMDSMIIRPDLSFVEGQSASPRMYIEMKN